MPRRCPDAEKRSPRAARHPGTSPLAGEQHLRHFAEYPSQGERGNRQDRRAMHGLRQSLSEFAIGHRERRGRVERSAHGGFLHQEGDQRNQVIDVNPRHPLVSAAEPSPDAQPEWREHSRQRASVRPQHHADPQAALREHPRARRLALLLPRLPRPGPGNHPRAAPIRSRFRRRASRSIPPPTR